jgi:hypothetical protein
MTLNYVLHEDHDLTNVAAITVSLDETIHAVKKRIFKMGLIDCVTKKLTGYSTVYRPSLPNSIDAFKASIPLDKVQKLRVTSTVHQEGLSRSPEDGVHIIVYIPGMQLLRH